MLYYLFNWLTEFDPGFDVFRYITVRAGMAASTAFVMSVILGPWVIDWLTKMRVKQVIREDGPETHLAKSGTPTMGGVLIVGTILFTTFCWADVLDINDGQGWKYIWTLLLTTTGFGAVGYIDDYLKIKYKNSGGMPGKVKLLALCVIGFFALALLFWLTSYDTRLVVPFFKEFLPDLGLLYIFFALLVVVGSSNAVNLTDGLDGLAIGTMIIVAGTFTVIAYIIGRVDFSQYLYLPYIEGGGEVAVFCGAILGASLGFLWFNSHPAQVFMGDVGALALGGAIGMVAVITKNELTLVIVGGLYVAEVFSVILQVTWFKRTGRRIFLMAPLHHHFEQKGWQENKVIVRFWIVQIILALAALSTLKLR